MMISTDKQRYITWADTLDELPIFFRPWYLDKVCTNGVWNAILSITDSGEIEGVLLYYTTKRYGRKTIIMPPLTPFGGIWLPPLSTTKQVYKIRKESQIARRLLSALPTDAVLYRQSFRYEFKNWLPFYWKGFEQTTRYTFIIPDLASWSLSDTATNVRNKINKASSFLSVSVEDNAEIVYRQTFDVLKKKGIRLSWPEGFFTELDQAICENAARLVLTVKDEQQRIHASSYIIIDKDTAYLMLLGSDPALRQSGAIPLVIYHSILEATKHVNCFDFEGSSMESLFDLFSGFGGEMTPFHNIYKTKNMFWDIVYRLKSRNDTKNR